MEMDARVASTWEAGSRDKFVRELTERVETAFSEIGAIARNTVETAHQQHLLEQSQLRQQLAEALETIDQQRKSLSASTDRIRMLEQEVETSRSAARIVANDLGAQRAEHDRVLSILSSIRSALEPGDPRAAGSPVASLLREEVAVNAAVPESRELASATDESVPVLPQAIESPAPKATWSEYASQLLDQIESSYNSDVESGERSSDVVDHLTEYLRLGRNLYATRFKDEPDAAKEFDRQLSATLDAKAAVPFGRHLGFAWYAITQPTDSEAVA